ncbi:MAG: CPBP family intramembrane metalloprotease [Anaerolineales bacterium]|nr:CPBP family intramembrane metalloprotease [Anaerolineales bacterium]
MTSSPHPSRLRQILLSDDEPRLRAGWRLMLHSLLVLLLAFSLSWILLLIPPDALSLATLDVLVFTCATWIARRFLDKRTFLSLGFTFDRHTLSDLAVGFFLPVLMFSLIYGIETAMGWLHFDSFAWATADLELVVLQTIGLFILFIAVGYSEELLSRGYHLQNLIEGINLSWALFLSSFIFGVLHITNPNATWVSVVGITVSGYFLAYGWIRTKKLWLSIGLHIGWNFFEGPVFGFPVSGMQSFSLLQHTVDGPILITGGEFGPEAGLVLLPAMLLGAFLIRMYTSNRVKPTTATER